MHKHTIAALAIFLIALPDAVSAGEHRDPTPQIRVTSEGSISLKPDMAIVSLTVTREAKTARAALDSNNNAMADVLAVMKQSGIAERDLQTSGFSIQPRYSRPEKSAPDKPPRIAGYRVSNSLAVRIRDLSAVGDILDETVTLGVNQGGHITFVNDDPSDALSAARIAAMRDAMERARTLTGAAGIGLGQILEISEQSFQPGPVAIARNQTMARDFAESVPLAAGENEYRVSVNVSFRLMQ